MVDAKNSDATTSNGRGRPSTRPLVDRVFDQWEAAFKAQGRADEHKAKLAKISSNMSDAEVETVQKMIADYKESGPSTVEGKITL